MMVNSNSQREQKDEGACLLTRCLAIHVDINVLSRAKRRRKNLVSGITKRESLSLSLQSSKDDDSNMNVQPSMQIMQKDRWRSETMPNTECRTCHQWRASGSMTFDTFWWREKMTIVRPLATRRKNDVAGWACTETTKFNSPYMKYKSINSPHWLSFI